MCQMCDEYENELVRMGLIEDAKKFREERHREHEWALTATRTESGRLPPERAGDTDLNEVTPKARVY